MTELRASDHAAGAIRDYRKWLGWSMAQLAEHCGLSENIIENIESGRRDADGNRKRDISIDELIVIAEALDVSVAKLLPDGLAPPMDKPQQRRMLDLAMSIVTEGQDELAMLQREQMAMLKRMRDLRDSVLRQEKIIESFRSDSDF